MATKGTKKELSQRHEDYVAEAFAGVRSPSSGAAITDDGDVRATRDGSLIECKGKFGELAGNKPVRSTLVNQFEKISDEAWAEGRVPALALRFYMPDSVLADPLGWVDLMVRILDDDALRSELIVGYGGA